MSPPGQEVTQLLLAWGQGDQSALNQLIPFVYQELRRIAHRYMAGERSGHTLQTTALANEAYLRLVDCQQVRWQDRAHFFARDWKFAKAWLRHEMKGGPRHDA